MESRLIDENYDSTTLKPVITDRHASRWRDEM